MEALDHPHVVEGDVQPLLLQIFKLASVVACQAKRDQAMAISPVDGVEHIGAVT